MPTWSHILTALALLLFTLLLIDLLRQRFGAVTTAAPTAPKPAKPKVPRPLRPQFPPLRRSYPGLFAKVGAVAANALTLKAMAAPIPHAAISTSPMRISMPSSATDIMDTLTFKICIVKRVITSSAYAETRRSIA